ncbi:MAG: T9SS type A sorting domain-containing protein [Candidatus Latescibacteria bacterium]|nr:T9SS type A sorting domain-containing protein [Candidatus Latescibacterota bacterium]
MKGLAFLLLLIPAAASAATHRVPSDYATIQAGIDACSEGDTVLVAPGTYTGAGNRDLNFHGVNLVLTSEAGPEVTVVDCELQSRALTLSSGETEGTLVEGFTIANGRATWGGAILCSQVSVSFRDLVLVHNASDQHPYGGTGGAIRCDRSAVALERVKFVENTAWARSDSWFGTRYALGGGLFAYSSQITMDHVEFRGNLAYNEVLGYDECCPYSDGGGAFLSGGSNVLRNCVFVNNVASVQDTPYSAASTGGALWSSGEASIENCVFSSNAADAAAAVLAGSHTTLTASAFVYNTESDAVHAVDPSQVTCCVFWANDGSDAAFEGMGGNLLADPMFCDLPGGNFRVGSDSPCLPENNDCGVLIGAFGAGCDNTPVLLASFTAAPAAGAVDLTWQASLGEFRLTAAAGETTWDVSWAATGEGRYSVRDTAPQLAPGGEFVYTLEGREPGETWQLLRALTVNVPPAFVTRLLEPHPNPFNPKVTVPFSLAAPGRVRVEIFDLAGRRVATLVDRHFESGAHDLTWDGADQASGVYLLRFTSAGHTESKRLVLLR